MKWFVLCLALVSGATFAESSHLRVECQVTKVQGKIQFRRMELDIALTGSDDTRVFLYDSNGKVANPVNLNSTYVSAYFIDAENTFSGAPDHPKLSMSYDRLNRKVSNVVWSGLIYMKDFYQIEADNCR